MRCAFAVVVRIEQARESAVDLEDGRAPCAAAFGLAVRHLLLMLAEATHHLDVRVRARVCCLSLESSRKGDFTLNIPLASRVALQNKRRRGPRRNRVSNTDRWL